MFRELFCRNAANVVTFLRVFILSWVLWYVFAGQYDVAVFLLLLSGLSDMFDGIIARRLGQESTFGAYFDAAADKCFLVGIYLIMCFQGMIPFWLAAIVLGRDFLILALSVETLLAHRMLDFKPSFLGKLSTVFQFLLPIAILCDLVIAQDGGQTFLIFLLGVLSAFVAILPVAGEREVFLYKALPVIFIFTALFCFLPPGGLSYLLMTLVVIAAVGSSLGYFKRWWAS